MNLSIFSFDKKEAFLIPLLFTTAVIVLLQFPLQRALGAFTPKDYLVEYRSAVERARPPSPNYYLSYDRGSLDHHVLYHGLFNSLEKLELADILVLGNSRTQIGLDNDVLAEFFKGHGLNYYNLSFGSAEASRFPLELIKRHDLRPKIVLINTDGFFTDELSDVAAKVIGQNRFQGSKYVYEKLYSFDFRRLIHSFYPIYSNTAYSEWIVYRSKEHGGWSLDYVSPKLEDFSVDPSAQISSVANLERARAVIDELRGRGAEAVLFTVPAPGVNYLVGAEIARDLELPFIELDMEGNRTLDGSHLDPQSSKRVTGRVVSYFEQRDAFGVSL